MKGFLVSLKIRPAQKYSTHVLARQKATVCQSIQSFGKKLKINVQDAQIGFPNSSPRKLVSFHLLAAIVYILGQYDNSSAAEIENRFAR